MVKKMRVMHYRVSILTEKVYGSLELLPVHRPDSVKPLFVAERNRVETKNIRLLP